MKKGQLIWENISKWILALAVLGILLLLLFLNREKMFELLDKIADVLRFGGR